MDPKLIFKHHSEYDNYTSRKPFLSINTDIDDDA